MNEAHQATKKAKRFAYEAKKYNVIINCVDKGVRKYALKRGIKLIDDQPYDSEDNIALIGSSFCLEDIAGKLFKHTEEDIVAFGLLEAERMSYFNQ